VKSVGIRRRGSLGAGAAAPDVEDVEGKINHGLHPRRRDSRRRAGRRIEIGSGQPGSTSLALVALFVSGGGWLVTDLSCAGTCLSGTYLREN
jgi:hypothetical protein